MSDILEGLLKLSLAHIEAVQCCCDCDHDSGEKLDAAIRAALNMPPCEPYEIGITASDIINAALRKLGQSDAP